MRKLHTLALVAALIGGALVAGMAPANAGPKSAGGALAQLSGQYKTLRNANNNLCLQLNANNDFISPTTCNGSAEQGWLALKDGSNFYRFVNGSGRGCLSVDTASSGFSAHIDNCTLSDGSGSSVSNAQWIASNTLPNAVSLRTRVGNRDSNLCLTPSVTLSSCGAAPQRWFVNF
jgi:hypothetical protein